MELQTRSNDILVSKIYLADVQLALSNGPQFRSIKNSPFKDWV